MHVTARLGMALARAGEPLVHNGARWLVVAAMVVTATWFAPAARVGASQAPGADAAATALLEAAPWTLVEYLGPDGALQPLLTGTEITATFREGRLGGSAGCNSYGSTYMVNGGALALSEAVRTLRLCTTPPGVM